MTSLSQKENMLQIANPFLQKKTKLRVLLKCQVIILQNSVSEALKACSLHLFGTIVPIDIVNYFLAVACSRFMAF